MHSRGSAIFTRLPRGRIPDFSSIMETVLCSLECFKADRLGVLHTYIGKVRHQINRIQLPNGSSFSW